MWSFCFFLVVIPFVLASPFTPQEVKEILDIHNSLRRTVYPTASNMMMLTWNDRLEALAQRASNSCLFEHNYGPDYNGLGENIYQGGSSSARNAVFAWWLEGENYVLSNQTCDYKNGKYTNYNTCGHYYQAAGYLIQEIGCARLQCPQGNLIFCDYSSYKGSPPYKAGPPCSACQSAVPFCYQRLCITKGDLETFGVENVTCELVCKNCATRSTEENSCDCDCPAGFSGSDCSVKDSPNAKPTCSVCTAAGTPCLNGGVESSVDAECRCQCVGEFSGLQCEINLSQIYDGLLIKFGGEMKSKSYYPVEHRKWPKLLSAINQNIVNGVNNICKTSNNFTKCCPLASADAINNNEVLLTDVNKLMTANTYPIVRASGELEAVVYISVPKENKFCSAASSWILDGEVLLAAYESVKNSLTDSLKTCCDDTSMKIISAARAGIRPLQTTTQAPSQPPTKAIVTKVLITVITTDKTSSAQSSMNHQRFQDISILCSTFFFLTIFKWQICLYC